MLFFNYIFTVDASLLTGIFFVSCVPASNSTLGLQFLFLLLFYVLFVLFFTQKAVPFVSKKKNVNDWLSYRSNWLSWEVQDFLFAHINRNEHSIEELRERALLEQEVKSKNQRRRNRSSLRNGGNGDVAVADPEDCLTYAMYPIEPEVLVCVSFVLFGLLCHP